MAKRKTSLIRSPDFKTIYAVGAIGNWTPYDFRINFYSEKVIEDEEESYVNDAQIILSPNAIKEFALWLMQNITDYEATYGKQLSVTSTQGEEAGGFKSDLREVLKKEIKDDLSEELKTDLRIYFKQSLQDDLKKDFKMIQTPELKKDLKKVLRADLKQDLHKDIRPELRKDLKRVLKADLKQDLREDIKKDIREEIRRDLHGSSLYQQKIKTKPRSRAKRQSVKSSDDSKKTQKLETKKK